MPPFWIPAFAAMGEFTGRGPARVGGRDMLSHQSLKPAGAGTPRDEGGGKPALFHGTVVFPRPTQGIHKGCPYGRVLTVSVQFSYQLLMLAGAGTPRD